MDKYLGIIATGAVCYSIGLISGLFLARSDKSDDEGAAPRDTGVVRAHGYMGLGRNFPIKVQISGKPLPKEFDEKRVLIKWVDEGSLNREFASAEWTWATVKNVDGVLHFVQ